MKKIILMALLALEMTANAQITLEHIYDSASVHDNNRLMMVDFEITGQHYVRINREGKTINIYDLNHSLTKTISYSGFPINPNLCPIILYLSEILFDNDPDIDFMWIYTVNYIDYTQIYNENGTLIFQGDSMSPMVFVTEPQFQFPIYNTANGTKMILSCDNNIYQQAKVFSLPGTLTTDIAEANGQLMQQNGQLSKLYPNPSNGAVTLQYELPEGETEGELILYNMQGLEVKRYKIDNTFNDILLDNTQLPAGTYFYQLQTSKGAVGTKKMVIIK